MKALRTGPVETGVRMLQVSTIAPNPDNPPARAAQVEDLVGSVREMGVLQAITVTAATQFVAAHPQHADVVGAADWVVLAGDRRLAASVVTGQEEIPAMVRSDLGVRADEVRLHENLHRRELTVIEEAHGYRLVMERRQLTQKALAAAVGVSQAHISKRLSLLDLPEALQERVASGEISVGDGLELVTVKDEEVLAHLIAHWDDKRSHVPRVDQRVNAAKSEVTAQRLREKAHAEAERLGAVFEADAQKRFGYQNLYKHEVGRDEKAKLKELAAAGDLVVAPRSSYEGGPELRYYQISKPKRVPAPMSDHERERREKEKAEREARKARRAFVVEHMLGKPSAPTLQAALTHLALSGASLGAEITELARQWAAAAKVGVIFEENNSGWKWRDSLYKEQVTDATRTRLAWIIALACMEGSVSNIYVSSSVSPMGRWYYELLTTAGYELSPIETKKMRKGK